MQIPKSELFIMHDILDNKYVPLRKHQWTRKIYTIQPKLIAVFPTTYISTIYHQNYMYWENDSRITFKLTSSKEKYQNNQRYKPQLYQNILSKFHVLILDPGLWSQWTSSGWRELLMVENESAGILSVEILQNWFVTYVMHTCSKLFIPFGHLLIYSSMAILIKI